MIKLSYDLHIHSCLSPCGHEDMTPANIVLMAKLKGLDVIALTDHNSCKNCPSFLYHAKREGIIGIPGMEVCTSEEVHVLCLFPTLKDAMEFDEYVSKCLIPFPNREDIFGTQYVLDVEDEIIMSIENLLINATSISFDKIYDVVKGYNGIVIPAHIDKKSNSVISNLGFIPVDSKFGTVEVSNGYVWDSLVEKDVYGGKCKRVRNSDAHELGGINEAVNYLEVDCREIEGILKVIG